MSLDEFKEKYARSGEGGHKLPLCSDTAWGANKASLHSRAMAPASRISSTPASTCRPRTIRPPWPA